ncbi:MAG TPA: hypothetical protein VF444_06105 [Pseudonocardiaceae bacterium]
MTNTELDQRAEAEPQHGELAHLTAECLAAAGLRLNELTTSDPNGIPFVVEYRGARCRLYIADNADVELEWAPLDADVADPLRVADHVAGLLSADPVARDPNAGNGSSRITFKGAVGRDLEARGFHVQLNIYQDETFFDVTVDIVVTQPDGDETSRVYVDDDGGFMWVANFWDEDVPAQRIAQAIADTMVRAGFPRNHRRK